MTCVASMGVLPCTKEITNDSAIDTVGTPKSIISDNVNIFLWNK